VSAVDGNAHLPTLRRRQAGAFLRARRPEDADEIQSLFHERGFLDNALMRDPFADADEINAWLDSIAATQRYELVAVHGDGCLGFAALYGQLGHHNHCAALFLGVREAARGQGVGDFMLAALMATARRVAGFAKVHLTVLVDNAPAIALYRKHGFEIEGLHRRFARRGEHIVDAYSMAALLDGPWTAAPTR
jgi:putative acetyltransferase